ncbi:unnamed protein product [Ectocarpus sp. 6 AP-2014]
MAERWRGFGDHLPQRFVSCTRKSMRGQPAMATKEPLSRSSTGRTLLLLFALTTQVLLLHAGATTTSSSNCGLDDCLADDVCFACVAGAVAEDAVEEYTECLSTTESGTTDLCVVISAAACCQDDISDNGCFENDDFVSFHECTLSIASLEMDGQDECTALACSDTISSSSSSGSGEDTSSTTPAPAMTTPAPAAATSISTSSPAEEVDMTSSPTTVDETMAPTMSRYLSTGDVFTSDDPCTSVAERCSDDEDCSACLLAGVDLETEYTDCLTALAPNSYSGATESAVCDAFAATFCCNDLVSDKDCLAVDVYVEFWECSLEFRSCSMDDDLAASCGDGDGDDGLDDGAFGDEDLNGTVATGYSRTVLALVLSVSFFVALP